MIKKKRKVHEEGRIFQEKWELQYFCISQNSKAHCLICHISISTMKEYNISRHYQNKHSSQYDKFKDQLRTMKLLELKAQLNQQQIASKKFVKVTLPLLQPAMNLAR